MKAAGVSGALRRSPGKPPMPHRELFLFAAWQLVVTEMHRTVPPGKISDACRAVLRVSQSGAGRRIVLKDQHGARIDTICDFDRLRKWYYEFETMLASLSAESTVAQRATIALDRLQSQEHVRLRVETEDWRRKYEQLREEAHRRNLPIDAEKLRKLSITGQL